jgi:CRP-like cAMP-binding protein
MLSGRPHSRSAVALEDTTLLALERDHLTRVGLREPRILLSLARVLAERLSGLEPAYAAPAGGRTLD